MAKMPPLGDRIHEDPLSRQSVTKARRWLRNCCHNHVLCTPSTETRQMPTRLIDVGAPNEPHEPHLIDTISGEEYAYTALSHSWGGNVALITIRETLASRKEGIPMADFPLTFRDAVLVTRALQIRYLWIDSLCIIQRDAADWEKEAAIMGDIFKNSVLTISATTAKNSTEGFLHPRIPRFKPIESIHTSTNQLFNRKVVFRPWLKSWASSVEGPDSPLSSRGWILQERLLPPRTLHFGHEQMFWECRSALCPEGHPFNPVSLEDGDLYYDLAGAPEWEHNKLFLVPDGAESQIDCMRSMAPPSLLQAL